MASIIYSRLGQSEFSFREMGATAAYIRGAAVNLHAHGASPIILTKKYTMVNLLLHACNLQGFKRGVQQSWCMLRWRGEKRFPRSYHVVNPNHTRVSWGTNKRLPVVLHQSFQCGVIAYSGGCVDLLGVTSNRLTDTARIRLLYSNSVIRITAQERTHTFVWSTSSATYKIDLCCLTVVCPTQPETFNRQFSHIEHNVQALLCLREPEKGLWRYELLLRMRVNATFAECSLRFDPEHIWWSLRKVPLIVKLGSL